MRARLFVFALVMLVAVATANSASGRDVGSAGPCSSGTLASTASYRLALHIGPQEEMYLASEVKARHIKTGEIMLGGAMAMVEKTAGTKVFHLELHVCTKSGAVVTKLKPLIVVDDPVAHMMSMNVPSAIMVGIGAPISDYHYGNELVLKPGDRVTVKVTVKGQLAVFHATVPK